MSGPSDDSAPRKYGTDPLTVRIPEACRLTGIGRSKLYELIAEGSIEIVKVGGMTLVSFTHPWKVVPVSLIAYQLKRMLGLKPSAQSGGSNVGLPVNLFDAMRVVMRKPS